MRAFLYSQHLSGTGHFVRTFEIARALARGHDVYLVDGGRPVPRPTSAAPFTRIAVPRICRGAAGLAPVNSTQNIDDLMHQRRHELLAAIEQIRPNALIIEHFPFSKWLLYPEITAMIETARNVNDQVKVICSLRDIVPTTRYDLDSEEHRLKILKTIHTHFDAILVHCDPRVVRLEASVPWAGEIGVPIEYTGYVSQKPGVEADAGSKTGFLAGPGRGIVIVSAGGTDGALLLPHCIKAWNQISTQTATADHQLVVFAPLFASKQELDHLKQQAQENDFRLELFTLEFLDWMQEADLSISHAGYNTCMNILETGTRAILVPNPVMSDQSLRARLLAERGLVNMMDPDKLNFHRLADAIIGALAAPRPQHDLNLHGACKTREILERLLH